MISILVPTLDQGGAERSMVHLANALFRRGCQAQLVTALSGDGVYRDEIEQGLPFVDLGAGRQRYFPRVLGRYISDCKPDIIVSALMSNWTVGIAMLAKYPVKIVISERSVLSTQIKNAGNMLADISFLLSRFLYPRAARVVAVSQGVADDLVAHQLVKPDRIKVIYNPVISDQFYKLLKEEMSLPLLHPTSPNFVAVGRFHEDKNYPLLIKAFAMLRRNMPCRLILFGEGVLRPALESLIAELGLGEDVLLPGFVRNPFPYITRASCFVLSSRVEGLPGALIQALGCGTTVVATNCVSGPAEILDNGKYGILVPVGDVEALHKGMCEALAHPFVPDLLRQRAQLYSEQNCINAYMELFNEIS